MHPEAKARLLIDGQLTAAGWLIQDRDQLDRHASLGVAVREYPMVNGPASLHRDPLLGGPNVE